MTTYSEMNDAIAAAEKVMEQADRFARSGVEIAAGRLERLHIEPNTLRVLKRELRRFDSHTGRWK